MANSGVIAFGTTNQRVGQTVAPVPLAGGSNLTNITVTGNTFQYSVSEVAILNVGMFLQTIDDDKTYSIEIFDVTAGTVAQQFTATADGQSANSYQNFVFNFNVISGHSYSIRMRGFGGGDNQLVVTNGTLWSTTLASGGSGGASFDQITSGVNVTATMTVGSGASMKVAIGGAFGQSSVEPTTTVLGSGTVGGGIVAGTAGINSVFIGQNAGATSGGLRNVTIGFNAGQNISGSDNVCVGSSAGKSMGSASQSVFIGASSGQLGAGSSQSTFVGNSSGLNVTGSGNTLIGQAAGGATLGGGVNNVIIGAGCDTNAGATGGAIIIGGTTSVKGSSSSIIITTSAITSSTTNDFVIRSGDTGVHRVAAGVLTPDLGSATAGWMQTAGSVALAASYTNNTATFSNTNLSVTLIAGRTYSFSAALYVSNSTITEGVKIDFGGGAATATSFTAQAIISDGTTVDASTRLTALTTVASAATLTNSGVILVTGTIVVNTGGTFIIRAAENSTAAGTLTMTLGSYLTMWDTITA